MASYLDDEYDKLEDEIRIRLAQKDAMANLQNNRSPDPLNIAADLAIGLGGGIAGGLMGTDGGAIADRAFKLRQQRSTDNRLKALDGTPELRALVDLARMRSIMDRFREGNEFKSGEAEKLRGFKAGEAEKDRGVKREGLQVKEREGAASRGAAQKRVETQISGSQKRTETQADAAMKRLEAQQGSLDERSEADRGNRRKQHVETVIATMKRAGYLPQMNGEGDITGWIKDPDYVPKPTGSGGKPKDESVLNIPGFTRTPGINPTPAEATKLREAVAVMDTFDKNINQMQEMIKKRGSFEFFGKDSAVMKSLYTGMQMDLKNLYDLGAITGPDMQILENQLLNPGGPSGLLSKSSTALAGLEQLRKQLKQMVSERLKARGFQSQGGKPDPDAKADEWLKSRGLSPSPSPSGMVRVTDGKKTYDIPIADLPEAERDGFRRVQ